MRNDIVKAFSKRSLKETDNENTQKINENLDKVISCINTFENECLNKNTNYFNIEIVNKSNLLIKTIETELINSKELTKGKIEDFDKLIKEGNIILKNILFLNKTIKFTVKDQQLEMDVTDVERCLIPLDKKKLKLKQKNQPCNILNKFSERRHFLESKEKQKYPGLKFIKLRKFDLSNENIFKNIGHLIAIYMCNNKSITHIDKNIFKEQTNLKQICLKNNNFIEIHSEIFSNCFCLTNLDLSANQLESIDKDMFKGLKSLAFINLSSNKLKEIHEETFSGLINLIVVNLGFNCLYSLPSNTLKGLFKLEEIWLNGNEFRQLDRHIFSSLINLKKIYSNYNKITELDKYAFKNLVNLEEIHLKDNKIEKLDKNVFNLIKLDYIDIRNNCFPKAILSMSKLGLNLRDEVTVRFILGGILK